MKTQDTIHEQKTSAMPKRAKGITRVATLGAIFVTLLIIVASAVVFAQLSQYHKNQSAPLPTGKWVQVLNGYSLSPPVAATSRPSTLYACATSGQNKLTTTGSAASYTLLRSTDFGEHWQDVGSKAGLGISCQIAVNPGDSNELYVVSMPGQGQAASVLKHSTDGGQTWETQHPGFKPTTGIQSPPAWNVQELSMVGSSLFGMQWMPPGSAQAIEQEPVPRNFMQTNRLVTSGDGGHTWTVLDQQLSPLGQSVISYVVDPIHSGSIYELVGRPWLPIQPGNRSVEPNDVPPFGSTADLYKTSDNGAHWHLLLQHLPFVTHVYLADSNPQLLYVGSQWRPMPYIVGAPSSDNSYAAAIGLFHLQVSSDGGASWSKVPDLSPPAYVQAWFVAPGGKVYVDIGTGSSYNGTGGGQATAVAGTPGTVAPATPRTMAPYTTGKPEVIYQPALTPPPSGKSTPGSIQSYDPINKGWRTVAALPGYGMLLNVTTGNASSDVLWFMELTNGHYTLYRYVA